MLDLGSDLNILPKNNWEYLGKPQLVYSPIQMTMVSQYYIFLVGMLEIVEVDVVGVETIADFEVSEINETMLSLRLDTLSQ